MEFDVAMEMGEDYSRPSPPPQLNQPHSLPTSMPSQYESQGYGNTGGWGDTTRREMLEEQNIRGRHRTSQQQQPQQRQVYSLPQQNAPAKHDTPQLSSSFSTIYTIAGNMQNLNAGKEYLQQNVDRYISLPQLRYFFDVDTTSVRRRLTLLLFPFFHHNWNRRTEKTDRGHDAPLPPRHDPNSPDLYLPCMAFITYILLVGILMGTQGQFTPAIFGKTATSALISLIVELSILELGLYFLPPSSLIIPIPILDLIALISNIFVYLFLNIAIGLFFNRAAYYISFIYTATCLCWVLISHFTTHIHNDSPHFFSRPLLFYLATAFIQFFFLFLLGDCPN
jgi:protein transport protein YIF1